MRRSNRSADSPSQETPAKRFCSTGILPVGPTGFQPVILFAHWTGETPVRPTGKMPVLQLKPDRELRVERVTEITRPVLFVLKAVLNLQLRVRRETVAGRDVGAPHIVAPRRAAPVSIGHVGEKLL